MELVILPDYEEENLIVASKREMEQVLNEILFANKIFSLKEIVVIEDCQEEYIRTVQRYMGEFDSLVYATDDFSFRSEAVTISGVKENGEWNQILLIRGNVYLAFLKSFLDFPFSDSQFFEWNLLYGREIFFHEIGHVITNQILAERYHYFFSQSRGKQEAFPLLIWSEYSAQRICNGFLLERVEQKCREEHQRLVDFLTEKIQKKRKCGLKESCQTAMFLIHYLSVIHIKKEKEFFFYNEKPDSVLFPYISIFQKFSDKMEYLYENRKNWDFLKEKQELTELYDELAELEEKRYSI